MALTNLLPRYTILFKIFIKYYLTLIVICIVLFILYKYLVHPAIKYYNNKNNSQNKNEKQHLDNTLKSNFKNNSQNKNEKQHLDNTLKSNFKNISKNKNEKQHPRY